MTPTLATEIASAHSALYAALVASGLDAEGLREEAGKHPMGRWNDPVVVLFNDRPVASYYLTFPVKDGKKTLVFNVNTFESVSKQWHHQHKSSPKPSSPTETEPSSF